MRIPRPIIVVILFLCIAGIALLSFIGGTKFPESQQSVQNKAPTSPTVDAPEAAPPAVDAPDTAPQINDAPKDSDIITELRDDGTRILWIRAKDGFILTQYKFDSSGALTQSISYRIDPSGSPRTCKVFDAQKTELFKVSYGYRKSDGMLVEERVIDSRIKRLNDDGSEKPVRRILHVLDSENGESKREMIKLVEIDLPQELEGGFRNPFQQNKTHPKLNNP